MKEADWQKGARDKKALSDRSASLTFGQKLRVLDRLRERAAALRDAKPSGTGSRRVVTAPTTKQEKK